MVTLWGVNGVRFDGCVFINETPASFLLEERGTAITGVSADFIVKPRCVTFVPTQNGSQCLTYGPPNQFVDLTTGIGMLQPQMRPHELTIDRNEFIRTLKGIIIRGGANDLVITHNEFEVNSVVLPQMVSKGIFLDDCTGFELMENDFTQAAGSPDAPSTAGVYLQKCGVDQNQIYRNTFSNISNGIMLQNENGGLQVKCNTFNSVITHWNVAKLTAAPNLPDQGECLDPSVATPTQRAQAPAGNVFSHDCPPAIPQGLPGGDFMNSGNSFEYRHHTGNPYLAQCTGGPSYTQQNCNIQFTSESCPNRVRKDDDHTGSMVLRVISLDSSIQQATDPDYLTFLTQQRDMELLGLVKQYFREDSLYTGAQAAVDYLLGDTTLLARRILVPLHIYRKEFTQAQTVLNNMVQDTYEKQMYVALHQWILDIRSSGREFAEMSATEEAAIRSMVDSDTRYAANAKAILYEAFGEEFPYEHIQWYPLPDQRLANDAAPAELTCFPVPAAKSLQIKWSFEAIKHPQFTVLDVNGRIITVPFTLTTDKQATMDISLLTQGVYFLTIRDGSQQVAATRFVVIH